MKLIVQHRKLNGRPVVLVVYVAADGAVEYWRSEDSSGAHVALDGADVWYAVLEMNLAISKMKRGAA